MLKDLTLINYQSHRNSHFEFSEGVNVIVGVSDSGKSSVFRGLKLILQNRPLGLSFHSNFAKKEKPTEVHLTVQNSDAVVRIGRIRSESKNEYLVEGFETPFEGFGTEVPKEVTEILNISDINCQFQMDAPFLFSDSPGAVARYLNKIVNLDKIDVALQNIAAKKRQNESEIKFQEGRLKELEDSIKEFPDLENIGNKITELENMNEELDSYIYTKELISEIISSVEDLESKIDEIKKISKFTPYVGKLEQILISKQKLESVYDRLFLLNRNIEKLEVQIAENKEILKNENKILELERLSEEIDNLNYSRKILYKLLSNIEEYEVHSKNKRKFIEDNSDKLNKLIGNICPLCEQPIGKL